MASTEDLIESLAGGLKPVRRLRPPFVRAALVIVLGTLVIALLALARGLRDDFVARMGDADFLVAVGGAWLTGATATLAAFEVSLPDRSRLWAVLPIPAAALWLYGFAYGCLAHWIAIPTGAPIMPQSMQCLETIVMATIPLGLALWWMLGRARPLWSGGTAWVAALAVAGYADTAHLLLHVVNASALVLAINLVPVTLIVVAGGLGGRRGLRAGAPA
jgi:hypothetical protein